MKERSSVGELVHEEEEEEEEDLCGCVPSRVPVAPRTPTPFRCTARGSEINGYRGLPFSSSFSSSSSPSAGCWHVIMAGEFALKFAGGPSLENDISSSVGHYRPINARRRCNGSRCNDCRSRRDILSVGKWGLPRWSLGQVSDSTRSFLFSPFLNFVFSCLKRVPL